MEGYSSVCVCLLTVKSWLNSIISKSKQATGLKFGSLRENVVLYKTGKFLRASVIHRVCKFQKKKNSTYRSYRKHLRIELRAVFYLKLKMRKKICGNFCRNARVLRYNIGYWPCSSPCCWSDRCILPLFCLVTVVIHLQQQFMQLSAASCPLKHELQQ